MATEARTVRCVRPGCGDDFKQQHSAHICCSEGCWTAILHAEIGSTAAGMRPLGLFGDHAKIARVKRKYTKLFNKEKL